MIGANYSFNWSSGDADNRASAPPPSSTRTRLTRTTLHDAVLLVPAKGAGKITVLSFESQLVDAGGY